MLSRTVLFGRTLSSKCNNKEEFSTATIVIGSFIGGFAARSLYDHFSEKCERSKVETSMLRADITGLYSRNIEDRREIQILQNGKEKNNREIKEIWSQLKDFNYRLMDLEKKGK